jgi:hypothetical protein
MDLHHVFTGEAARRLHQQQQGLINPLTAGRIHHESIENPMALPNLAARRMKHAPPDRQGPGA